MCINFSSRYIASQMQHKTFPSNFPWRCDLKRVSKDFEEDRMSPVIHTACTAL